MVTMGHNQPDVISYKNYFNLDESFPMSIIDVFDDEGVHTQLGEYQLPTKHTDVRNFIIFVLTVLTDVSNMIPTFMKQLKSYFQFVFTNSKAFLVKQIVEVVSSFYFPSLKFICFYICMTDSTKRKTFS